MVTLNLALGKDVFGECWNYDPKNRGYSQKMVGYKIQRFPDGQKNIVIENQGMLSKSMKMIGDKEYMLLDPPPVRIKSRLNNWLDLELIVCAVASLRELGIKEIHLYCPYIVGARSDRQFEKGGNNYIKTVLAPVINSLKLDSVSCVDPHSDVLEACINNFKKISNLEIVRWSLLDIDSNIQDKIALVSPDAGALKKIYDVAKTFNITNVTNASKVRDIPTGKIIKTEIPDMDLDGIEHFVVIDDICDGGRTFIELAKEIKKQTDKPLYLIVTHGIFSAGFDELLKYFSKIYCTNSYADIYHERVEQLDLFGSK